MKAFVAYIRELRKSKGLSQEEFAYQIGISPRQLVRIENEENLMKSDTLMRAVNVLNADLEQIQSLLVDTSLSEEDGIRMARQRLAEQVSEKKKLKEEQLSRYDEPVYELLEIVGRMREDKNRQRKLVEYAKLLVE